MELTLRLDIVDQLSRVDSPTLVSVGELDPVTPVGAAEEIFGALPEDIAQLEIIARAGHFTWLDAPNRFWPIIFDFIQGVIEPVRAHPTASENGAPIGSGAAADRAPDG
jgi:pimeloyl-ACP methyl ester carboxylesterase